MLITQLTNCLKLRNFARVPFRCKHRQNHLAVDRKKKSATGRALEHFDDFYNTIYGRMWPDIRAALLMEDGKYMALVNNFSDTERITESMENNGAINLGALYNAQRRLIESEDRRWAAKKNSLSVMRNISDCTISEERFDDQSYSDEEPEEGEIPSKIKQPTELLSITDNLSSRDLDSDRIVDPASDLSFSSLYQYIPATKLKGMEDYILESEYYDYYTKGADFSVKVEKQKKLNFPEHLKVFTYEEDNDTRFASPRKGATGVLDYYLLDGGSILPVLALDLRPNDDLLDMCAAPGGKSLAALQTLLPGLLVANDVRPSRTARIQNVLDQYLDGMGQWGHKLMVTQNDARCIAEQDMFNKILVDVPCTTDRHALHEDDNNIFKSTRVKERLQLPEIQTEILLNALKIVRPGGTVVYSTCSLSPIQNDGVVQMALKKSWEETNSVFVIKNMSPSLQPFKHVYNLSRVGLRYGHVVLPSLGNNFGPMYFCKIIKIR